MNYLFGDYSLGAAFIVGLMGAGHCFGMCGGLIGALSSQIPIDKNSNKLAQLLRYLLSYNFGRKISYTIAGGICGGLANGLGYLFDANDYLIYLRIFAGIMMIITGLYIAQIWFGLVKIEKLGKNVWIKLKPLANSLLPMTNLKKAFKAGFIWGWLPCGLVYSMLTWSVASGSAITGASIMIAFGLGTFPALICAGVAAKQLLLILQNKAVRTMSGLILIAFGVQTLYIAIAQLN